MYSVSVFAKNSTFAKAFCETSKASGGSFKVMENVRMCLQHSIKQIVKRKYINHISDENVCISTNTFLLTAYYVCKL